MSDDTAPFSARVRGAHKQIEHDFPATGRIGLLHLLDEVVRRHYVQGWDEVVRELARIARVPPSKLTSCREADVEQMLRALAWQGVYDFCERLHSHLAKEVGHFDENGDYVVSVSRGEVQAFVTSELQRLFLEEGVAFEFRAGVVSRRGRRHSVERISRAELVLGDL